jgi:O-methyltransferase involved in polyketide biosynthesis
MELPASLRWVEVDLPDLLAYKDELLASEKPRCGLERVRLDLADVAKRRELFERLGASAKKALVVSEGLLIYLSREEVVTLAEDLAAPPSFQRWIIDLVSPGLMRLLQKQVGSELEKVGAPFKFAPPEGVAFFAAHGWPPLEVRGMLKTGAQIKRLPMLMRLFAMFPEPKGPPGDRPWGGVCLLEKK